MRKANLVPKVVKIKTPLAELQAMSNLADSPVFQVIKRWARRYSENLKNKSFRLNAQDSNFQILHTRYLEQAVGMEILIRAVEGASKKLEELEKKGEF